MKLRELRVVRQVIGTVAIFGAGCLLVGSLANATALQGAHVHPSYRGTVPAKSDVVFSSRFTRPEALPLIEAFGATRVEWVYTKDEAFARRLQGNGRLFGAALSGNGPLPSDDGFARDFDGAVLVAPWMKGWGGRWVTTTHPDTQREYEAQVRRYIGYGATSLQHDDPQLQTFAALNQAGDFNASTVAGFPDWLAAHPDRRAVEAAGLAGFRGDYREWLRERHGVSDASDYRKRFRRLPSTKLWVEYLRSTVGRHFARIRSIAAEGRGAPVPISMNLSVLYEPLESNPFFFLAAYADYSMAETHIEDWPLMVSQAATARALGLGFVPSIRPRSTAENRVAIAALYALGGQPIVPWDMYAGNDEQGQAKRYFGTVDEYGDLFRFVRSHADLFDGTELVAPVGVVVPTATGRQDQVRALVRRLVGQGVPFAFVPAGAGHDLDVQRVRSHSLLVLTNPPDDYPAPLWEALRRGGVRTVQAAGATDAAWSDLRPYVAAPGAERLRVVMRANPAAADRLLVHVIDESRGEPAVADAECSRRIGIRREQVGPRPIVRAAWHTPQGTSPAAARTDGQAHYMTLRGCPLWGVLELRLAK